MLAAFLTGPEIVCHTKFFLRQRTSHLNEIIKLVTANAPYLEGQEILRPGEEIKYLYIIADG